MGIKKPDIISDIGSVPRAGLEPALAFKCESDFKSDASTNSATEAFWNFKNSKIRHKTTYLQSSFSFFIPFIQSHHNRQPKVLKHVQGSKLTGMPNTDKTNYC